MVREALFSILGHAVPGRPFFDVFAGTGVNGFEAVSRGASSVTFVERDFRLIAELESHIRAFGVADKARVARADVYRWAEHWKPPAEPVCVFCSPPFRDYTDRLDSLLALLSAAQDRVRPGSVLALQAERGVGLSGLPDHNAWDERTYGRNRLLFWVKEDGAADGPSVNGQPQAPG